MLEHNANSPHITPDCSGGDILAALGETMVTDASGRGIILLCPDCVDGLRHWLHYHGYATSAPHSMVALFSA